MNVHERPEQHRSEESAKALILQVIDAGKLGEVVHNKLPQRFEVLSLFGGDRLSCCDEGLLLTYGGEVLGLATIAPYGEGVDPVIISIRRKLIEEFGYTEDTLKERLGPGPVVGQSTIVGVYVTEAHRRKGYGTTLLKAAMARGQERGFDRMRADVVTPEGAKLVQSLPEALKGLLDIHGLEYFVDKQQT